MGVSLFFQTEANRRPKVIGTESERAKNANCKNFIMPSSSGFQLVPVGGLAIVTDNVHRWKPVHRCSRFVALVKYNLIKFCERISRRQDSASRSREKLLNFCYVAVDEQLSGAGSRSIHSEKLVRRDENQPYLNADNKKKVKKKSSLKLPTRIITTGYRLKLTRTPPAPFTVSQVFFNNCLSFRKSAFMSLSDGLVR